MVSYIRMFALSLCFATVPAHTLLAQEAFHYREFLLGSDLASVAKLIDVSASSAKLIHARPAVMKDLEWRPRYYSGSFSTPADPVDVMVFRFYDDRLFKVIVDYDRRRTEGMAAADMIEGISAVYGPVSQLPSRPLGTPTVLYGFPDTPLAVWGNDNHSVTLFRVAYPAAFRLVVALTPLEKLARTASAAAAQLDTAEAPQRELERQKKEADVLAAAQDKAKTENKAQFKP
jgi:hypothetical protein